MKAELDIKPFLKAINEFRTPDQQPCGVQVVEWVGLVASGFQFLLANHLKSYKKLTMATHGAYCFSL